MTDGPIIDLPPNQYQRRGERILVRERDRILRATGRASLPLCILGIIAHVAVALFGTLLLPGLPLFGVVLYLLALALIGWNVVRLIRAIPPRELW